MIEEPIIVSCGWVMMAMISHQILLKLSVEFLAAASTKSLFHNQVYISASEDKVNLMVSLVILGMQTR